MIDIEFGQPIPCNLNYAVSFSIPTWDHAIGYAKKDPKLIKKMATGYPRFFPQPPVQKLSDHFIKKFGRPLENCRPFPSYQSALQCVEYVKSFTEGKSKAYIATETFTFEQKELGKFKEPRKIVLTISGVLASTDEFELVKEYWKLRGEIVSSRLATFLNHSLDVENKILDSSRKYLGSQFFTAKMKGDEAKKILKKRLADYHCGRYLERESNGLRGPILNPDKDIYLVPTGMSTIFTARKILESWEKKRIYDFAHNEDQSEELCGTIAIFGFLFKNTQVIVKRFGTAQFFGFGDSKDMEELQKLLNNKERILAVFVETPSNPLLNMPDLARLRKLADSYGFHIVIDDTIGGLNVEILPFADIVCTSLTKLFSGTSNVMGGSIVLNPESSLYREARRFLRNNEYEELLWCEDATVLELNSRDFPERTLRANLNTEKLLDKLLVPEEGKILKKIYYPTKSTKETFENYELVRSKTGRYGSLFSLLFYSEEDAATFYDSLQVFKGPSNGTNFTLICPYSQIVHYSELEEVSKFGVEPNLIRVSVGLEEFNWLENVFSMAIKNVRSKRF